jgi:SulP family sulfate permease
MSGRWRGRFAPGFRPAVEALRRGERRFLVGEAVAGLTVAAYLIPQVLAYAEVAGLAPVAGLWAAAAALVAYVALGSSRQLSIGPESTTALMTAIAVAPLAAGDPTRYAALAAALALIVAAVCLLARAAHLGFLSELLSRPVLVGYLAGIALVMVSGQLDNLTGVSVEGDGFIAEVASFATNLDAVHVPTVLMSAGVLAVLATLPAVAPRAPAPLLAVLLATAVTALLPPGQLGLEVVGAVPVGLPAPALPAVGPADLFALLGPALGVAVVAFSDNMLTGRAFADRHGERLDADRELLALGAANAAAGLVHGFPVSSSGSRTALADALGARSQLYSVTALLAVLGVLWVAGPLLAAFPAAALGALVAYAALRLIDLGEFARFARFRRSSSALLSPQPWRCSCSGCSTGCSSPSGCRSWTCSAGCRARTTPCSASCRKWPACTTSTTTRKPPPSPAWWCTATTRRCASPTPRTSGSEPWPPRSGRPSRRRAGSSSTSRPSWRST